MAEEKKCQQCGSNLPANAPGGVCPRCVMRLGLPTGVDPEHKAASDDQDAVPTSATPPGGFVPPEPAELAKKLPELEIIELLGQGGMGAVYKARQKQLDRIVALKILPTETSKDPAFAERFAREARSLARLNHPHIVALYEFGRSQDLYYFIMEFVDGTDLRQVIQAGELAPDQALAIVPQICDALQYAHEEGIVHRDIKPENIFLDKKGRVKIGDFGLAKILNKSASAFTLTQPLQRMGTPHYMAPEQIEGASNVDHRADIYSLGVVFYEMLTGELPLGRFAPPSKKVQIDVRLDEIVLHTLEKEPELRYQHASEVKTEVESVTHSAASAADATPHQKEAHTQTVVASRSDLTQIQRAPSRARLVISGIFWFLAYVVIGLGRTVARTQPEMYSFTDGGGWYYTWSYHRIKASCAAVAFVCFLILWFISRKNKTSHLSLVAGRLAVAVSKPGWFLGHFWLLAFFVLLLGRKVARTQPVRYHFFGFGKWLEPWTYNALLGVCIVVSGLCLIWAWLKPSSDVGRSLRTHRGDGGGVGPVSGQAESIEAARRRLRIPSIGLLFAGLMSCVLPAILLGFAAQRQFGSVAGFIAVGFIFGTGLIMVAGAWAMTRVQSYRVAVAGSIVAMFSVTFLLGLPMGIWAIVVLSSSEVQAAFAANRNRPVGISKRWNPSPVIATIGIVAVALALLVPVGILLTSSLRQGEVFRPNPITIFRSGPETSTERIGDLDFPSGTEDYVKSSPDGPTLSEQCIETLDLKPSEVLAVNKILRNASKEYFELEAGNMTKWRIGDHLEVTIAPFPQEAVTFLEKLWADLDKALDERKRAVARRHLPLRKMFGAFEFGRPTVMITIDKDGSFFNYDLKYEWPEDSGRIGGGGTGRTNTLDPVYQRLWDESSTEE